jgi:hypothetical protein
MEPDNALYDAACDRLSAARRMDRAVRRDGVEPAIPAMLGCLHATLAALTSASPRYPATTRRAGMSPSRTSYSSFAEPPRHATPHSSACAGGRASESFGWAAPGSASVARPCRDPGARLSAHAPFRKSNGRDVGFACGYGNGSTNLASRAHARVGTIR